MGKWPVRILIALLALPCVLVGILFLMFAGSVAIQLFDGEREAGDRLDYAARYTGLDLTGCAQQS